MNEQIGPKIEIKCTGCKYLMQTYWGVSEPPHYLEDPDKYVCTISENKVIPEIYHTPDWCPRKIK